MWKTFHQLRNNEHTHAWWNNFITVSNSISTEMHLALQLLLKLPLHNEKKMASDYMAGYVAVALMKNYKWPVNKLKKSINCFSMY